MIELIGPISILLTTLLFVLMGRRIDALNRRFNDLHASYIQTSRDLASASRNNTEAISSHTGAIETLARMVTERGA